MSGEKKQGGKPKGKSGGGTPAADPPYTEEETKRLIAAAMARLQSTGEISADEARAVTAEMKRVTNILTDFHQEAVAIHGELNDRMSALEATKWKVKPLLEPMFATPPEAGIGKRIAYCRGQLDNLPIEALARYTKNFEKDGISRQSLVRYESGDTMPGAREFRTLCDALWVPANWLLYGVAGAADENSPEAQIARGLRQLVRQETSMGMGSALDNLEETARKQEVDKRRRWLDEARRPQPRK